MCPPVIAAVALVATVASTAMAMKSSADQGTAQKNAANYQAQVAQNNALLATNNARVTRQQGDLAAQAEQRQNAIRLGAQRAAFAANGVDPNAGSAMGIQLDTAEQGGLSAANTQYNALLRGLSFENEALTGGANAAMSRVAGANAEASGRQNAMGAGLQGVSSFASRWDSFGPTLTKVFGT